MIVHFTIRILLILVGYGLATIASGVFVGTIFTVAEKTAAADVLGIIAFAIALIGMYAALPALVAVVIGEAASIRRKLYYIAAASLIGVVLPVLVGLDHWYILVGLGFGPVAGMIYWVIAGRKAGLQAPR